MDILLSRITPGNTGTDYYAESPEFSAGEVFCSMTQYIDPAGNGSKNLLFKGTLPYPLDRHTVFLCRCF